MLNIVLFIVVLGLSYGNVAKGVSKSVSLSTRQKVTMDYAILGVAGGCAETIACKLLQEGKKSLQFLTVHLVAPYCRKMKVSLRRGGYRFGHHTSGRGIQGPYELEECL